MKRKKKKKMRQTGTEKECQSGGPPETEFLAWPRGQCPGACFPQRGGRSV